MTAAASFTFKAFALTQTAADRKRRDAFRRFGINPKIRRRFGVYVVGVTLTASDS